MRPLYRNLWIGIILLIVLSPIGLFLPELLKAGGAWGEWGTDELKEMLGYVPERLEKLSELWHSPFPDYTVGGWTEGLKGYASYIITGFLGVLVVVAVSILLGKALSKNDHS
jgi:hypothetical protein